MSEQQKQTDEYLSLFDYTSKIIDAFDKFHINEDNKPTPQEVILLYVCYMFEQIYYLHDELYMIDIYIINRFYDSVVHVLQQKDYENKNTWCNLWCKSSKNIIKYTTQQELETISKWFKQTEDIVLNIVASNKQFDYIIKYDKKLSIEVFNKYIKSYLKYYTELNNINIEEEDISE